MSVFTNKSIKNGGGYAMLELLFYISFFAGISIAVVSSLITMIGSFRETSLYAGLAQDSAIMERLSREVRSATSIASIGGSTLTLNTTDEDGDPKTVQITLAGTDIELRENGVLTGDMNSGATLVDSLSLTSITTTEGVGVKIQIAVHSKNDPGARTFEFFNTVVLRGEY